MNHALLFVLTLLPLGACATDPVARDASVAEPHAARVEQAPAPKGHLLIVGGGGTSDEMFARALELGGGKGCRVVVLPQASALAETGQGSADAWKKAGATNVESVALDDAPLAAKQIGEANVIWFPGGDQKRLMVALGKADLVELIRARYRDGAVVGGTSAGAAVMSRIMITGEYNLEIKKNEKGEDEDSGLKYVRPELVKVDEGLGLISDAIVDQHFVRRQRFNRLVSVLIDHPGLVGIGIDEKTAILVSQGSFEVLGSSNVIVVDGRRAAVQSKQRGEPAACSGFELSVLRAGMKFDFSPRGTR